jgi:uncharacterized damage-inducible protein DinB
MTQEIKSFNLLLDEGFNRAAWHGPNLLGSLRGITIPELLHRLRKGGHNAWELAVHCAYWKYAVRNRLVAGKRNTFPLPGSNFFRRDKSGTLADWKKDLALLKAQHKALKATILGLAPRTYGDRVRGGKHTVRRMVLGIAAHDIYHAGQISLLKRMAGVGKRAAAAPRPLTTTS